MQRREKFFRIMLVVVYLFSNINIQPVSAATAVVFSSFDSELISMDSAYWDLYAMEINSGNLSATDMSASASLIIDISSIAESVDQGGLEINFSGNAFIASEAEIELDQAAITIGFGGGSASPSSTVLLDRGIENPGNALSLTSSASIPTGTRYLFVQPSSVGQGTLNTAVFSDFALSINDLQTPTITYILTPSGWTNGDVQVTLTASDADSGIEGIYNASDEKISSSTTYSFTASANNAWTFTAKDYAGKVSDVLTVTVDGIDLNKPATPTLTVATSDWSNQQVGYTISDSAAPDGEAPQTQQFRLNGGAWQAYAAPAFVDVEGESTLEARIVDEAGNASDMVSETVRVDLSAPEMVLSAEAHTYPTGGATITATISDAHSGIATTKYASGSQTADYFVSAGTVFSGSTFDVANGGTYSVYAIDQVGHTTVQEISINTYPTMDTIENQIINEDTAHSITFNINDDQTAVDSLVLTASSTNSALYPSLNPVINAGQGSLDLTPSANGNGSADVTLNVRDAAGLVSSQTFTVTVNAVNDAPTVVNDSASTDEDQGIDIDVLDNDSDVDGDTLTIDSTAGSPEGLVTVIDSGSKLHFEPTANWYGTTTFTYTVSDDNGGSGVGTVTVTVNPVDDAPEISTLNDLTIDEDNNTGNLPFTVTDTEGDSVIVTATSDDQVLVPNANISIVDVGGGSYTLLATPVENQFGTVTITVSADDGVKSSTEEFVLTVDAVNDNPIVADDTASTTEDSAVDIYVLANDSDVEGEAMAVSAVGTPSHGSVIFNEDYVTYTPEADYNGSDSFTYTVSDASGGSSSANVTVSISSEADVPVANSDTVDVDEDDTLNFDPLANDTDADIALNGDSISIVEITGELYGTVTLAADKLSFTYKPNLNSVSTENLSYTITDTTGNTASSTITITVNAINDAPQAVNDAPAAVDEDTAFNIDVLDNDQDVDLSREGDTLLVSSVGTCDHGTVSIINDGALVHFIPEENWNGVTTFDYTMKDKENVISSATVTVTINAVNDAPVISAITDQTIDEDGTTGVLNFTVTDVEGDVLSVSAAGNNDSLLPASAITLTDEGSSNYTITLEPLENQNGSATVTISADDGTETTTRTFDLTVNAVNDAPVANVDTVSVNEDASIEIAALINDTDVEGDTLSITEGTAASHGTVEITSSNTTVTYTPTENYNGSDTFDYTISDGHGGSAVGTVNITVNQVNDNPVAKNDSLTINEDETPTIDVLANDTDVDLTTNPAYEVLTVSAVTDPPHGSAVIVDNKVEYTPDLNYFGSDSFTYTMHDTDGVDVTATVNLTIKSVNDYPEFANLNETYQVNEDEPITFHFDISDVETTTESLMLQVVSQNQSIVSDSNLVLEGLGDANSDTVLTITPNLNKNQDVIIKLTLGDGFVTTSASFILDIVPVNDAPVPEDDEYTFVEDSSIPIDMDDLITNDTDIDGDTLSFVEVVPGSLGEGTLSVLDAGENTYTYTPPANFDGVTTFQYTMTDSTVQRNATVTLKAQPINDAPILTLDGANPSTFDEDNTVTLYFTIADYETEVNKLSVQAGSSDPDLISSDDIDITCDAAGNCSMLLTPGEDQNGSVTISLSLSDGSILVSQDIALTINPIQDVPVASADSLTLEAGGTVTFSPLENDHDADAGDTITLQSLDTTGMLGSVVNNGLGVLTYTAPTGTASSDSFSYTINDGNGHTASAVVSITISGGNTPPEISEIANQFINEDTPTAALSFIAEDADVGSTVTLSKASDNETLVPLDNIVITQVSGDEYTVSITPAADKSGTVTITLTATDDESATDSTSFVVTVYPINDLPIAVDDNLTINEDTTLTFSSANLLGNDIDVDEGTVLEITNITDTSHGRMTYNGATDEYTYRSDSNYNGSDSFEYTITDGETTDTATVNITINPVNDNPVAYSNWWTVSGTLSATYNGDIRTNDYDIETADADLTVTIVTPPSYGTAVVEANGTVTYTRDDTNYSPDWKDSFTYTVSDDYVPAGVSGIATVYIDDYWGPSIYGDTQWFGTDEDNSRAMTLAIHDGYGEGYTVSFPAATLGTITDPDNTDRYITYVPNENVYGSESVTYTLVSNATGNPSGTGTLHITIYPINDAPVISPALPDITIGEDTTSESMHVDISDVETDAADLVFTVSSSNPDLVLDSGINVTRTAGSIDFTVTPLPNRFGTATITLLASDNVAQTTQSFTLTVSPVNDVPVADDYSKTTNEDIPLTMTVISPNADMDGDALTVTVPVLPEHGSVVINGDNTITYSPALNYNGPDSFTYQLTDALSSDTGVVSLTVNPVNDAPEIVNLLYNQNTLEDTAKTVSFVISDVDNVLNYADVSVITDNTTLLPGGSISVNGMGTNINVTLTPAANLSGSAIQTVTVSDGMYGVSQDFKLTVASVNDVPVANDDTASTDEDVATRINVITNDTDIESGTLTVVSFVDPAHGSVANNRDGTLTYTPDENWFGTDTFTYTIADINNGQDSATVAVTVAPVNDAPEAVEDRVTIAEDNEVTLDLLANDSDVEGSALSVVSVSDPTKGTYTNNGDGTITYKPNLNEYGTDTFTYDVSDGDLTSTGTIIITMNAVNDPPAFSTTESLPWELYEDTPKLFPITITDPETASDNLVAKLTSSDQTLVPDTSITLTGSGQDKFIELAPLLNQFGTLDLTIEVTDGVNTTTDVYTVNVLSVNDLPTITAIPNQTIAEDTSTSTDTDPASSNPIIRFSLTDIETPAADLTVTAATADGILIPVDNVVVTNGSGGNRMVVLTPATNKVGDSLVTLTVHDADGGTADSSFTLTVTPVNDPPSAVADNDSVDEDDSVTIDVLGNDVDVDLLNEGDTLTIVSVSGVDNGTVNIAADSKTLTFTPTSNWNGTETFNYVMKDAAGVTSNADVTVTVNPLNDTPIANDDGFGTALTTVEDHPLPISVLANDTDVDISREGDDLTIVSVANVDNGSVTIAADNKSLTFTPDLNWFGTEEFTYTITDTHGATATANVRVAVTSDNDTPVISDIADQTLTEDTLSSEISFTVSDVESAAGALVVSAASSDGLRIPVSNIVFGGADGNRTFTINPAANKNTWNGVLGAHETIQLTINVSDGSNSSSDTFNVTINPINDTPVAEDDPGVGATISTNEDTPRTIQVVDNDSDVDIANEGDTLIISATSGVDNGTVSIAGDGQSLTFTPALDFFGTETFTYTLQDSYGATDTADVILTVNAVNDAPTISGIANQSITEDSATNELAFTINDVDDSISCADVSAVSSAPAIIPDANIVIGGSGTNCTVKATPLANKNTFGASPVSIAVTVDDGLLTNVESFTVEITPLNDAPTAINDTATVVEDHAVNINVLTNDTDIDLSNEGDTLVVLSTADVDHGTVVFDPVTYILTYTPEAQWSGTEEFTYTMEDSAHVSSSASVTVSVTADNDVPQAVDDSDTVAEDGSIVVDVLGNDTDIDLSREGDTLIVYDSEDPAHGTVTIAADNLSLTYAPDTDWVGTEKFNYTIHDSHGAASTAEVTIIVTAVNDAPTAHNDTISSPEDQTATLDVLANDTDVDLDYEGDNLIILSVNGALHGSTSVSSDQKSISYVPDANWQGNETLTYYMEDKEHQVSSASITLNITPVNDPPQAVDDSGTVSEDNPLTLTVLDNDTDIDFANEGDVHIIDTASVPAHGTVSIAANNLSLTYTPNANWNGTDEFTYDVKDNGNATSTGTVTVTVTAVNDAPDAIDDNVTTPEEQAITISVLDNDIDVDLSNEGDTLLITAINGVDHGTANITDSDTTITFTPELNWYGTEFFTYTIKDNNNVSDTATVTVIVSPVNDNPSAVADSYTINEDTPTTLDVLANDLDDDPDDELIIISFADEDNASLAISSDQKTIEFTPDTNWNGTEEFSYTLQDNGGVTSTANVTVQVTPVNDTPVAVDDTASVDEDSSITINVMDNDSDVDILREGDSLSITAVNDVDNATYTVVNSDKSIQFTPDANWNGVEIFNYTISDSHAATATASVTVTVIAQDDSATAVADSATCLEDGNVNIDVLANDIDADLAFGGDNLKVVSVADVDHGMVNIAVDQKSVTFTPAANWNGTEVFSYTMEDHTGSSSSTLVTVTVTPQNDAPSAVDDTAGTDEDVPVVINVLDNDVDIDLAMEGDQLTITGTSGTFNGNVDIATDSKTLTYTPPLDFSGSETFTYTMQDAAGSSSSADVTVTISAVDDAPVISTIADQTINEDTLTGPLAFTLSDVDSLVDGIIVSATSSNQDVVSDSSIVMGGSGANRTISITPLMNKNTAGTSPVVITLRASSGSATGTNTFRLTVNPVNDTPQAYADAASMNEDTSLTLNPLQNDTDIDLQNEGDNLTIINVADVDNGVVQITNAGKNLVFTPTGNWFGVEEFTYTLQDQGGIQSSAMILVSVADVPEPSSSPTPTPAVIPVTNPGQLDFKILAPFGGEQYKDGNAVQVRWTALPVPGVTYTIEFFDGEKWVVLASGLTDTVYSHELLETHLHTDGAYYRVKAEAGNSTEILADSKEIVIDNVAPQDIQVALLGQDGSSYNDGEPSNQPVEIVVEDGWDMTGITLKVLDNGQEIISGVSKISTRISDPGTHVIQIVAVDALGNESVIEEYTVVIIPDTGDGQGAVQEPLNVDTATSVNQQNNDGGNGGVTGWIIGALGFLLLLFFWPNVKIIYSYRDDDGKIRKVTRYKRVFAPNDDQLKIKVKGAESYKVVLGRWLTRQVRGGSLTIEPEKSKPGLFRTDIPEDTKKQFKTEF